MAWFPFSRNDLPQSKEARIRELEGDVALAQHSAKDAHDALKHVQHQLDQAVKKRMEAEYRANAAQAEKSFQERRANELQRKNGELAEELGKMAETSQKLANAYKIIDNLKKKLNIRNGTEKPYGASTTSARLPHKPTSKDELRQRKGGGKPGHKGNGRRQFSPGEADRVETEVLKPEPAGCCDNESLELERVFEHSSFHVIPMKIEKVIQKCGVWRCTDCGKAKVGPLRDTLPGMLYDNHAIAEVIVKSFAEFTPYGQVAKNLAMNKSTLLGILHNMAERFKPVYTTILSGLKQEEWLHADETPWRNDGANGYAWLFLNDKNRVFMFRQTRASSVPKEIFGETPLPIVLITDRYSGYSPLPVEHQYCYVHLLRDLEKIRNDDSDNVEVAEFVKDLTEALKQVTDLQREKELPEIEYYTRANKLKHAIMEICKRDAKDGAVRAMQDLFREKEKCLFQWVLDRRIPCHNNNAERSLRPVVIARKISFGCQGEKGLRTREVLTTVVQTALARGINVREFIVKALNMLAKSPDSDLNTLFTPTMH